MKRLAALLRSDWVFYVPLGLLILAAVWIAISSVYPMAFDEEFHYGLIKIYATNWLPYGITHTSDMAQYGAATADPSYLFHYLMSFPYRLLHALRLSDPVTIVVLRFINIGFVVAGLIVLRTALQNAGIRRPIVNFGLFLLTLIPVFVLLTAQINYDNLLFLVVAWSVYLVVDLTNRVRKTGDISIQSAWLLAVAVLLGVSIKYAFLPIALSLIVWSVGLVIVSFRRQKRSPRSYVINLKPQLSSLSSRALIGLVALTLLSVFFASHYVVNHSKYGHAIPSCEQVFSVDECNAYGPWSRNRSLKALRSRSFVPLSFPAYMVTEWVPGMAQRLTFAVAGKTNDFDTNMPLPVVVYTYVFLTVLGAVSFVIQAIRRKVTWFGWLTILLMAPYVGVLSLQLYENYVDTAQPIAINGRYLLLLLPLIGVVFLQSISQVFRKVPETYRILFSAVVVAVLLVGGAGVSTYILQSEQHWFWPGFGQASHAVLKTALSFVTLPFRFNP